MIVSPARPDEIAAAVALALGHDLDRDPVAEGEIDARGVFVAREGDDLRGAVCCQPTGGTSALIAGPRGEAANDLIVAGLAWLRERGVRIVHAMAHPESAIQLVPLERHGFVPVGPMEYLRLTLGDGQDLPPTERSLTLRPFEQDVFARTLERTYIDSLDFPELMGTQTLDDIFAGYRANPAAREENWYVAESAGEPVGVLMLTEVLPIDQWDLTYLGIVPERRRRGLGRSLVRAAIAIVHARGGERLEVAVDARNASARQLYRQLGFQLVEHRLVSLAILSTPAKNGSTS